MILANNARGARSHPTFTEITKFSASVAKAAGDAKEEWRAGPALLKMPQAAPGGGVEVRVG